MTRILGMILACCMASTVAASPGWAADAPNVVAERERTVPGGRPVEVIIAQREIETTIDVGRVASSANGGGLLGAIIISEMDDKRKVLSQTSRDRAEAAIAPLRRALQGFDVDALALTTTKAALAKPAWFQPSNVALAKAGSSPAAEEPQSALVIYRYETSPDFTQIRVVADIRLARTAATSSTPFYREQISSIVLLRAPSLEASENVARWSADEGKLAKAALANAFARLEQLIPFALDLSEADAKAIAAKGRHKAFAAGYYGPSIQQSAARPGETLVWAKGFVNVQPSPMVETAASQ